MDQNPTPSKVKRKIYFASSSKAKLIQLAQIMESIESDIEWIHIPIDIDEIQSMSNQIVAEDKIIKAYEYIKNVLLIDQFELVCEDTGFAYANMNGFPGALIRYYHDSIGNHGICKFNGNSRATNISVVAYTDGTDTIQFTQIVSGIVPDYPRPIITSTQYNNSSSELDTVFVPDYPDELSEWTGLAYSEIPIDIKNKVSARAQSLSHLKNYLITKLNNNYSLETDTIIPDDISECTYDSHDYDKSDLYLGLSPSPGSSPSPSPSPIISSKKFFECAYDELIVISKYLHN